MLTGRLQELLQSLKYAEECGKLISPPCWKTGRYCTGKLQTPVAPNATAPPSRLLQRAHAAGLKVYPFTFRNEVRRPVALAVRHHEAAGVAKTSAG